MKLTDQHQDARQLVAIAAAVALGCLKIVVVVVVVVVVAVRVVEHHMNIPPAF